jgi:transcription initiation factor TFIIIB Brf1 subunit/transcription initiation factor TFIIB
MAASILYLVSHAEGQKAPKTRAEIAKAAPVTENHRSKELPKSLGIDLDRSALRRLYLPRLKAIT